MEQIMLYLLRVSCNSSFGVLRCYFRERWKRFHIVERGLDILYQESGNQGSYFLHFSTQHSAMFIEHLILYMGWARYWAYNGEQNRCFLCKILWFYQIGNTLNCSKFYTWGSIIKSFLYVGAEEVKFSLVKKNSFLTEHSVMVRIDCW